MANGCSKGRLELPGEIDHWPLTKLRENLEKTGAKVVRNAKYVMFSLAEVAVLRSLSVTILDRISSLAMLPPSAVGEHRPTKIVMQERLTFSLRQRLVHPVVSDAWRASSCGKMAKSHRARHRGGAWLL